LKAEKLLYLDAIRGLAALTVVFSHLVLVFYPHMKLASLAATDMNSFAGWIAMTPLSIWHEGDFAVHIFFVLSGLVLSLSFFKSRDREKAISGAVRRYFRLTLPIFATVMLAYLLHRNDLFFNDQVAAQITNDWLAPFYKFDPSVLLFLKEGLYGAILNFNPDHSYANVLWTMEVEFLGSLFVFGFLYCFGNANYRPMAYVAFLAILLTTTGPPFMADFLLGIILCDLLINKNKLFKLPFWLSLVFILAGLFLGGLRQEWLALPGARYWDSIGAVLVIVGVSSNVRLRGVLQLPMLSFLGKISFSLYLIHWLVLMSLGCGFYILMQNYGFSHDLNALAAGFICVPASIVLAWLFYHCADRPAIWLSHAVYRRLRRQGGIKLFRSQAADPDRILPA
jgi:peptidoglycan/LPS O-acetylase OafA/YrhL